MKDNTDVKIKKDEIIEKMELFFNSKCFTKILDPALVNTQDINLITLGRNMTRILNKMSHLECVTHIILENQISTLASRMKTIQGMLAQYFIMRFGDSVMIEFVSSSNKLKGFPKRNNEVSSYKNNKSDAVYYTREILLKKLKLGICNEVESELKPNCQIESNKWVDFLVSKKKDDLCDCFLQCIWYLQRIKSIKFNEEYLISILSIEAQYVH
jgi:hypothetical protein